MSTVEITTFQLAEGVTDESFLTLDRRIQTELIPNQPGFLRRTTARQGQHWLIVTLWAAEDAAVEFQRSTKDHALPREFTSAVDATSLRTERYETLD